jgi:hypothetical protein
MKRDIYLARSKRDVYRGPLAGYRPRTLVPNVTNRGGRTADP